MGFRNLMREIGLDDEQPTTMYQDCQLAIKATEGKGSMGARAHQVHGYQSVKDPRVDLGSAHQASVLQDPVYDCRLGYEELEYQAVHLPAGRDESMATHW
jgi:hypothetical protein